MVNVCPLCDKRVSDWVMSAGKAVVIADRVCHKACIMDHDLSVQELEDRIKQKVP